MRLTHQRKNLLLDASLVLILIAGLLFFGRNILNIISPFIAGLVLAYLIDPMVNFIQKKGVKRIFAVLLIFLFLIMIIAGLFIVLLPRLIRDISVFISEIPRILQYIQRMMLELRSGELQIIPDYLNDFIDIDRELDKIADVLRNSFNQILTALLNSSKRMLNVIMTPILAFYYSKDKERLVNGFLKLFSRKKRELVSSVGREIDMVLGGYIKGQMIVAIFVGTLTGIGCFIIGVPYALTVGFVAGLTNIIPYFGPWIGGILPVMLAFMKNPLLVVWVVVLIVVIQQTESSLISPQVMSHSVGLHPLTVIFSLVLFGNVFGILGMIIGVPLAGTIKVIVRYVMELRKHYRVKVINDIK